MSIFKVKNLIKSRPSGIVSGEFFKQSKEATKKLIIQSKQFLGDLSPLGLEDPIEEFLSQKILYLDEKTRLSERNRDSLKNQEKLLNSEIKSANSHFEETEIKLTKKKQNLEEKREDAIDSLTNAILAFNSEEGSSRAPSVEWLSDNYQVSKKSKEWHFTYEGANYEEEDYEENDDESPEVKKARLLKYLGLNEETGNEGDNLLEDLKNRVETFTLIDASLEEVETELANLIYSNGKLNSSRRKKLSKIDKKLKSLEGASRNQNLEKSSLEQVKTKGGIKEGGIQDGGTVLEKFGTNLLERGGRVLEKLGTNPLKPIEELKHSWEEEERKYSSKLSIGEKTEDLKTFLSNRVQEDWETLTTYLGKALQGLYTSEEKFRRYTLGDIKNHQTLIEKVIAEEVEDLKNSILKQKEVIQTQNENLDVLKSKLNQLRKEIKNIDVSEFSEVRDSGFHLETAVNLCKQKVGDLISERISEIKRKKALMEREVSNRHSGSQQLDSPDQSSEIYLQFSNKVLGPWDEKKSEGLLSVDYPKCLKELQNFYPGKETEDQELLVEKEIATLVQILRAVEDFSSSPSLDKINTLGDTISNVVRIHLSIDFSEFRTACDSLRASFTKRTNVNEEAEELKKTKEQLKTDVEVEIDRLKTEIKESQEIFKQSKVKLDTLSQFQKEISENNFFSLSKVPPALRILAENAVKSSFRRGWEDSLKTAVFLRQIPKEIKSLTKQLQEITQKNESVK